LTVNKRKDKEDKSIINGSMKRQEKRSRRRK
jgi:hypothetical protein